MARTERDKPERPYGQGSLRFNKQKQRWCGTLTFDGKTQRVFSSLPGDTKDARIDAKKRLDALLFERQSGIETPAKDVTVAYMLDEWRTKALANRMVNGRPLSPKTLELYDWALPILKKELGHVKLRNLDEDMIEAAFARRVAPKVTGMAKRKTGPTGQATRPLGTTSLKKLKSTLSQALTWAMGRKQKLVTENVARNAILPATAAAPKQTRSLTLDQAKALLAAAEGDRLSALWMTMLMCGLRPGEAAGLYWEDVDQLAGVIHVRRSLKVIAGQSVVTESVKSKASRRSLDAPKPVLDALASQFTKQTDERELLGSIWVGTQPLVFTTSIGTPLDPSKIRRAFKALTERAGLGADWHPHELRHSNASLLSAAGVPIEKISDLLGHSETRTTERTYRHELASSISHGKAAMEQLFT